MLRQLIRESSHAWRLLRAGDAFRWHLGLLRRAGLALSSRSLAPGDAALGNRVHVDIGGRWFDIQGSDFGICRELIGGDCYRFGGFAGHAEQVLDLGANSGVFSLFATVIAPRANVTAVDANPRLLDLARLNLREAGVLSRVTLINEFVGSPPVTAAKEWPAPDALHLFDPEAYMRRVGRCDFLKCDVEGSEHSLFSGNCEWLDGVQAMSIEYHWEHADGYRLAGVLKSRGFAVEIECRRRLGYLHCRRK